MAKNLTQTEIARAQIKEEYGIELDDSHLNSVVMETDRILGVARQMVPKLSFDSEPANFPASLARLRDPS
jgi:hypothetical protein